jgi:hypothetical protein
MNIVPNNHKGTTHEETDFMEHRGVHYVIRMGIERGLWHVAIRPPVDALPKERIVSGTREDAEKTARSMIDRWISRRHKPTGELKSDSI